MQKSAARRVSPRAALFFSNHWSRTTDHSLFVDTVGYAKLRVLIRTDEAVYNVLAVRTSQNLQPVCLSGSIGLTIQEGAVAACYELLIADVLLLELIAEEESLGSLTAADLMAVQLAAHALRPALSYFLPRHSVYRREANASAAVAKMSYFSQIPVNSLEWMNPSTISSRVAFLLSS